MIIMEVINEIFYEDKYQGLYINKVSICVKFLQKHIKLFKFDNPIFQKRVKQPIRKVFDELSLNIDTLGDIKTRVTPNTISLSLNYINLTKINLAIGSIIKSLKIIELNRCHSNSDPINLIDFFSQNNLFYNINTLKLKNSIISEINLNFFTTLKYLFLTGRNRFESITIPKHNNLEYLKLEYSDIEDVMIKEFINEVKIQGSRKINIFTSRGVTINKLTLEEVNLENPNIGIKRNLYTIKFT